MATLVTPTNIQKMEFNVTAAEGTSRVTIVTGRILLPEFIAIYAIGQPATTENRTFRALVDPTLTPAQFRKAVATASLGDIFVSGEGYPPDAGPQMANWGVSDAQAFFDDEAGRVQFTVDVTAQAFAGIVAVNSITFQVTTLSKI